METIDNGPGNATVDDVKRMRLVGGHLALDFANTRTGPTAEQPADEAFRSYRDLVAWGLYVGLLSADEGGWLMARSEAEPDKAGDVFEGALALREAVAASFHSLAAGRAPSADDLAALEAAETEALGNGHLSRSAGGFRWTWSLTSELAGPLWPVAHAAVELLESDRLERLKSCPSCSFLFLDQSKNGSRRWCSMADCGAAEKARLFVARRAARRRAGATATDPARLVRGAGHDGSR